MADWHPTQITTINTTHRSTEQSTKAEGERIVLYTTSEGRRDNGVTTMEISVRTSLRNIIHCLELSQCLSKDLETEQQMLDKVEYRYLV